MAIYTDLDIEMTTAADGDITVKSDFDAVKNSIINIISTLQGDRRMLPQFALNVHYLLFDPIDDRVAHEIGVSIVDVIKRWDDRVIIQDLLVQPKYDLHQYNITLTYTIRGKEEEYISLDYILKAL